MSLKSDVDAAVCLLEDIQISLQECDDDKMGVQCTNDLNTLISVLRNPVLNKIVSIQDALKELKMKVTYHPSLLPADFDISCEGKLIHLSAIDEESDQHLDSPEFSHSLHDSNKTSIDSQSHRSTPNDDVISSFDSSEHKRHQIESMRTASPLSPHCLKNSISEPENGDVQQQLYDYAENDSDLLVQTSFEASLDTDLNRLVQMSAQGRQINHIQLYKREGTTLGFSVVGLKSEQRGDLGIYVQDIQPNGIAGMDGRLQDGDQILAIDGQVLDSFISHQEAISILQKATKLVDLFVARAPAVEIKSEQTLGQVETTTDNLLANTRIVPPSIESHTSNMLNTEWAQVEVIHLVNDGSGLGFGIIGGKSTGVVVKTILPRGVADREGRLQSGDHILQIGDVNLRGLGSDQVAAVLRQAGSHVRLVVARPVESCPPYMEVDQNAPIVETRMLNDPDELERHLNILTNGFPPAMVLPSDELPSSSSATLLSAGVSTSRQTDLTYLNGDTEILTVMEEQPGAVSTAIISSEPSKSISVDSLIAEVQMAPLDSPYSEKVDTLPIVEGGEGLSLADLPEMENLDLHITKDYQGLGITIAGYVCEREELSGIFVKSINAGSAADRYGRIQVNDQIIEVDGQSLFGLSNHAGVEVLRATGKEVHLKLARYLRGPKFEQLQQAIANSEMKSTPTTPNPARAPMGEFPDCEDLKFALGRLEDSDKYSPAEYSDTAKSAGASHTSLISNELADQSQTQLSYHQADSAFQTRLEDLELLIDNDFVGELKSSVEGAIKVKWSRMVDQEMEIVVAQLSKFERGGGLGISLEGTVDVEDGKEVRPHHYIRSILPDGPVGRNGSLQSGDELLEVNNRKLLGLNHVEVVNILKELPQFVRLVCGRRLSSSSLLMDVPTGDSDAFSARNILGGSLQNLSPSSERLVKAKSDGSLASSTAAANSESNSFTKVKSRSLEPLTGLAMWNTEPQEIELLKGERGLGFSILDYQDPLNLQDTVIVIRSLVPGGVAEKDGRLIPGDRLVAVNGILLDNASLDTAVAALKGSPKGPVRISVAKPIGVLESPGQVSDWEEEQEEKFRDGENFAWQVEGAYLGHTERAGMRDAATSPLKDKNQDSPPGPLSVVPPGVSPLLKSESF